MDFKNFLCFSDVGGLGNRICQLLGNIKLCEEKYNSNIYLCFKNKKYDIFSELFDINFIYHIQHLNLLTLHYLYPYEEYKPASNHQYVHVQHFSNPIFLYF